MNFVLWFMRRAEFPASDWTGPYKALDVTKMRDKSER